MIINKSVEDRRATTLYFSLAIGTIMLGVFPYSFVIARSEQIIILCIALLCLMCMYRSKVEDKIWAVFIAFAFFIVSSGLLYIHPKSLFFSPLILFCAVYLTAKRPCYISSIYSLIAILLIYEIYRLNSSLLACDSAPIANQILRSNNIELVLLIESPIIFFKHGILSILNAPGQIISHILFQTSYQSGWLPPFSDITNLHILVNNFTKFILFLLVFAGHFGTFLIFVIKLIKKNLCLNNWLGLMVAGGSLSTAFLFKSWNFYSGSQFIPLSLLLMVLAVPSHRAREASSKLKLLCALVCLFSTLSMMLLVSGYLPLMIRNSNLETADIPGQPLSVPTLSASEHLSAIRELSQQCKIDGDMAKNLVVDHMTYYAFRELQTPIHALYISESVYGGDLSGSKLRSLLVENDSPGVISRCNYVPEQLRSLERIESKGYCCINLKLQ